MVNLQEAAQRRLSKGKGGAIAGKYPIVVGDERPRPGKQYPRNGGSLPGKQNPGGWTNPFIPKGGSRPTTGDLKPTVRPRSDNTLKPTVNRAIPKSNNTLKPTVNRAIPRSNNTLNPTVNRAIPTSRSRS